MLTVTDNTPTQGYATVGAVPVGAVLKGSDGHIYLRTGDNLLSLSNVQLCYTPDSTICAGLNMREVNATLTVTSYV